MIVWHCHKTNSQCQILSVTTPGIVSQDLLDDDESVFSQTSFSKPQINSSENSCPSKNWRKNWTRLTDLFSVGTEMELGNHLAHLFPSSSPWSPVPSKLQRDGRWVGELWSLSFYLFCTLELSWGWIRFNWRKRSLFQKSEDCLSTVAYSCVWV